MTTQFDYLECPALPPYVERTTALAAWDMARKVCAELNFQAVIVTFVRESASLSQPDQRALQSTAWELSERKRQVSGFTRPGGRAIWINGDLKPVDAAHVALHEVLHLATDETEAEVERRTKHLHARLGDAAFCAFCASV